MLKRFVVVFAQPNRVPVILMPSVHRGVPECPLRDREFRNLDGAFWSSSAGRPVWTQSFKGSHARRIAEVTGQRCEANIGLVNPRVTVFDLSGYSAAATG